MDSEPAKYRVNEVEIENRFTYHEPKDDQAERYDALGQVGRMTAEMIDRKCPESREKALAFTNLEQAIMWAKAAIARRE